MRTEDDALSPKPPNPSLGLLSGFAAFISWGLVPLYWKLLQTVPALEILCHRLLWSLAFSAVLLSAQRRWREVRAAFGSMRQLAFATGSAITICFNWFIFIWAVNSGHVVETSLGYFMIPLVNVLLGAAFFGERLRRLQWVAVALAAVGVFGLTLGYGVFPWIGVVLCASFAVYGVLRKISRADSLPGLFLESAAAAPLALGYIVFLALTGVGSFVPERPGQALLLISGGVITALPLLWFAHAARNIPLSTLGLLQYLAPTLTFLLGTLLYDEPFTRAHLFTFACIWTGLAIFTADARWHARKRAPARAVGG